MALPTRIQHFLHSMFFLSVGLGLFVFLFSLFGYQFKSGFLTFLFEENYFYELLTCLFLGVKVGVVFANRKIKPLTKTDYLIVFLCIFIIGEELSWGWQFHQFSVSEFFAQYNDQKEPNIHNLELLNGFMVEAFLYFFFCLFIVGSLVFKSADADKFNVKFRCFLLFLFTIIYSGLIYRVFFNNTEEVSELFDMPEELIEYSIAYFILFTNFNDFNASSFSEFSLRKLFFNYRVEPLGDIE